MSARAIKWAMEVSRRLGVPTGTRLTLVTICWHHHDGTGACFPSYDTLADETGQSRRKVINDVAALEANGLLRRQRRRVHGHQGSNQFELFGRPKGATWRPSRVQETDSCEGAPGDTQPRVHGGAPDRENLNNRISKPGDEKRAPARAGRDA